VQKEITEAFEEMEIFGDKSKEYSEKIARVVKDTFPSPHWTTEQLWITSENEYFFHRDELEQAKKLFVNGSLFTSAFSNRK